jgi:hypothetical protein
MLDRARFYFRRARAACVSLTATRCLARWQRRKHTAAQLVAGACGGTLITALFGGWGE